MATKGRIEYRYVVLGGPSLLIIEVEYTLGSARERLDAIAQVIAGCRGTQTISLIIGSNSYTFHSLRPTAVVSLLLP